MHIIFFLQGSKIYGKDILKYVPIQGWTWYFTESIFLKRDWEVDREILKKSIAEIVTYPPGLWVAVSIWLRAQYKRAYLIIIERQFFIFLIETICCDSSSEPSQ